MSDIADKGIQQLESIIILLYKHDILQYLPEESGDNNTYEVLMALSGRKDGAYYIPYTRYMTSKMADLCGSCLAYFGHTYGGRYRAGCHLCMDHRTASKRLLDLGRMIGSAPDQNIQALVVDVLYKYHITGEDVS